MELINIFIYFFLRFFICKIYFIRTDRNVINVTQAFPWVFLYNSESFFRNLSFNNTVENCIIFAPDLKIHIIIYKQQYGTDST